jgi:hypothetical protein
MTHTRVMLDSEGDFGTWVEHPRKCHKVVQGAEQADQWHLCGAKVFIRAWDSHDGAYTDYNYRCENGHTWWIDGPDA